MLNYYLLECESIEVTNGKCYAEGRQSDKREYCFGEYRVSMLGVGEKTIINNNIIINLSTLFESERFVD